MLLRRLEYLAALSREGHFGRAADACHISQPALSAGIRKLESELGVQIVQRGQRFQGFTPEGTEVLRWAQRMLAEQDGLRQELDRMRGGLTGVLRIGAIPTALTVASLYTTALHRQHPRVTFSLRSMSSREIVTGLNEFEVDVGMTYVDGEPLGKVRVVPLYRERYLFLTPRRDELASRTTISWQEAAESPLCLLGTDMQNRRIIDGNFAAEGAEAHAVVETDTVAAIYAHVETMNLSSVIPHTWLHRVKVPENAMLIPMSKPARSVHVGLVLTARDPASLLARALVEAAQTVDLHAELGPALKLSGVSAAID
jgi:DNA-binding transcriptional LysR family regulator